MLEEQLTRAKSLLGEATKATGIVNARAMIKAAPGMEDINAQGQDYEKATVLGAPGGGGACGGQATRNRSRRRQCGEEEGRRGDGAGGDRVSHQGPEERGHRRSGRAAVGPVPRSLQDHGYRAAGSRETAHGQQLLEARRAVKELVGDALVKARTGQSEHDQFKKVYDPLVVKQTTLTSLTEPPAAKITAKTDPLVAALKTARAAGQGAGVEQGLRGAERGGRSLPRTRRMRRMRAELHDATRKTVFDTANTLTDPVKTQTLAIVTKADEAADKFDFTHAKNFLDNAQARLMTSLVRRWRRDDADLGKIGAAVERDAQGARGRRVARQANR